MTGFGSEGSPLAQQFARLRETLDAEYDGFCAWCQASVHEQPHASECEGRHALAALSSIERHVQDMASVEWASREGMVTVYRADGSYAGCMGVERWQQVLDEDARAALPAREKGEE